MDHEQWLEQHDRMLKEHERIVEQHDRMMEQHDRMMADHNRAVERHERMVEQHDRMMADFDIKIERVRELHESTDGLLRRAIRDSVREARNERERRRRAIAEIDEAITKVAAAQLITEEKLQRLLERDERRYGGNGGH